MISFLNYTFICYFFLNIACLRQLFPTVSGMFRAKGGDTMESIIEELYYDYGNIAPAERSFCKTGEYAHILQLVTRNEEKADGDAD